MRLLQEAIRTYDFYKDIVGVYEDGRTPLIPVAHMLKKLDIVITVSEDGDFCDAVNVSKENIRAIFPATKKSAVRTANVAAHPLCDNLTYLGRYGETGSKQIEKNDDYKKCLKAWSLSRFSHPLVDAVYKYVSQDSVVKDLAEKELLEIDESGYPTKDSLFIGWVLATKDDEIRCWECRELMGLWQEFILSTFSESDRITCMISGTKDFYWNNHPKGTVPGCDANAKLISQEYSKNKFKSRFLCKENSDGHEDVSIGYISSQKAHNALRWMLGNFAVTKRNSGTHRDILCWSPVKADILDPVDSIIHHNFTDNDNDKDENVVSNVDDYKALLRATIQGYKKAELSELPDDDVIIASFDGMTPGRTAITYYNEMKLSDYLERLSKWDETFCYYHGKYGIISPSLHSVVRYTYGSPRKMANGKVIMDVNEDIYTRALQKLLSCKLEGRGFPLDIKNTLVHRAGNPDAYDRDQRARLVELACAAIIKSRKDRKMEEYSMALEPDRLDRDYLFGRLLAILEKVESDIYKKKELERTTNAERLWPSFEKKPLHVAKNIITKQKSAYYPRLKPAARVYYECMIEDIFSKLMEFPEQELNKPLKEVYLLGYYAQKNELYRKKSTYDATEDDVSETSETA